MRWRCGPLADLRLVLSDWLRPDSKRTDWLGLPVLLTLEWKSNLYSQADQSIGEAGYRADAQLRGLLLMGKLKQLLAR